MPEAPVRNLATSNGRFSLEFIDEPLVQKGSQPVVEDGRPVDPNIAQIQVVNFDPYTGEGEWRLYRYPDLTTSYKWEEFHRACMKLPASVALIDKALDYAHNYGIVNIHLKEREMTSVVPRPKY